MGPAEPAAAPGARLDVEVVWDAGPHAVRRVRVALPTGATARDALAASGLLAEAPALAGASLGLWGRACAPDTVLRDRDRVEVYRPLQVDPKEARRQRQRRAAPARR